MSSKKIITVIGFAIIAAILYWVRAEFDISLSKYATVNAQEDIEFNWGTCLLWSAIGAVIGALPMKSKDKNKSR